LVASARHAGAITNASCAVKVKQILKTACQHLYNKKSLLFGQALIEASPPAPSPPGEGARTLTAVVIINNEIF